MSKIETGGIKVNGAIFFEEVVADSPKKENERDGAKRCLVMPKHGPDLHLFGPI